MSCLTNEKIRWNDKSRCHCSISYPSHISQNYFHYCYIISISSLKNLDEVDLIRDIRKSFFWRNDIVFKYHIYVSVN